MKVREVQKGPLKGIPQGLSVGSLKLDPRRSTKSTNPNHQLTMRYDDSLFFNENTSPVLLPTENRDQLEIHPCIHIYLYIYIYIIHTLNSIAIGSPNVHWLPCRLSCLHLLVAWDVLPASAICWMLGSRDWNETTQLSKV